VQTSTGLGQGAQARRINQTIKKMRRTVPRIPPPIYMAISVCVRFGMEACARGRRRYDDVPKDAADSGSSGLLNKRVGVQSWQQDARGLKRTH
jgi:hypothetical protein